eukprot:COSAG04_NODE_15145_length_542_cov_0.805869_1_plen_21_part_10
MNRTRRAQFQQQWASWKKQQW